MASLVAQAIGMVACKVWPRPRNGSRMAAGATCHGIGFMVIQVALGRRERTGWLGGTGCLTPASKKGTELAWQVSSVPLMKASEHRGRSRGEGEMVIVMNIWRGRPWRLPKARPKAVRGF